MARSPSARVVLNRSKLTELGEALADGAAEVCRTILDVADPPDAEPFGQGLVTRGGYLVYNGANKVAGFGQDGKQPKKPRAFAVRGTAGIQAIVGFGFPARFQEFGTVKHGAQPFFTPAVDSVVPHVADIMRSAVAPRLRGR